MMTIYNAVGCVIGAQVSAQVASGKGPGSAGASAAAGSEADHSRTGSTATERNSTAVHNQQPLLVRVQALPKVRVFFFLQQQKSGVLLIFECCWNLCCLRNGTLNA